MNEKIFETLEFNKVKALIKPYLTTAQGKKRVRYTYAYEGTWACADSF